MSEKIKLGILFGGKSAEHEISIRSARNIIAAINRDKYELILTGIDREGRWLSPESSERMLDFKNDSYPGPEDLTSLAVVPGNSKIKLISLEEQIYLNQIDVIFPVLHGSFGEDGTIQGLLRLMNLPFVGSGVLGSAVGMDKVVMKKLLKAEGIPISDFEVIYSHEREHVNFEYIKERLGLPLFIKPASLGSSVGVHKVFNPGEFEAAMADAFQFDNKVLVEEFIEGREIECAVLGNEYPKASVPGEIVTNYDFYSYKAKYIDENGAVLEIPAKMDSLTREKIMDIAVRSFKAGCCEGMARVDFFLKKDGSVIVNELNTIPGFTSISMYPKLWQASGIEYGDLIERLINLAERLLTNYAVDK